MFYNDRKKTKKKNIIIFLCISVLLVAIGFSFGYRLKLKNNKSLIDNNRINSTENDYKDNMQMNGETDRVELMSNISDQELTVANTTLIFERLYNRCLHKTSKEVRVEQDEVGMNEQKLMEKYPGWTVELFTKEKVVMQKEIDGYCPLHYIIKDEDGNIVICKSDEETGIINIIKHTSIKSNKLPADIKQQLIEGIPVESLEEIENILESWDS